MGYVPIVPFGLVAEKDLRRDMRGRTSRFRWRRERAYRAVRELIRRAELELGYTRRVAPPKPLDARRSVTAAREFFQVFEPPRPDPSLVMEVCR